MTSPVLSTDSDQSMSSCDIDRFFGVRIKYSNNPVIGFLNINSLRNKIIDLRLIVERCKPDVLVIGETKLNASFKTETLSIDGYQNPYRKDRTEFGGGLVQYIRNGIVCRECPVLKLLPSN